MVYMYCMCLTRAYFVTVAQYGLLCEALLTGTVLRDDSLLGLLCNNGRFQTA